MEAGGNTSIDCCKNSKVPNIEKADFVRITQRAFIIPEDIHREKIQTVSFPVIKIVLIWLLGKVCFIWYLCKCTDDNKKGGGGMIISASRRTDIPTYYSEWLFHRLKEGHVLVRNPMNIHQIIWQRCRAQYSIKE